MRFWTRRRCRHFDSILIPGDFRFGNAFRLAVQCQWLVFWNDHGGRMLGDMWSPKLTLKQKEAEYSLTQGVGELSLKSFGFVSC